MTHSAGRYLSGEGLSKTVWKGERNSSPGQMTKSEKKSGRGRKHVPKEPLCSKKGRLVRVGQAGELGTLRPASEKLPVAAPRVDQGKGPEGRDTEPGRSMQSRCRSW